jgi:hypothetical protein
MYIYYKKVLLFFRYVFTINNEVNDFQTFVKQCNHWLINKHQNFWWPVKVVFIERVINCSVKGHVIRPTFISRNKIFI